MNVNDFTVVDQIKGTANICHLLASFWPLLEVVFTSFVCYKIYQDQISDIFGEFFVNEC